MLIIFDTIPAAAPCKPIFFKNLTDTPHLLSYPISPNPDFSRPLLTPFPLYYKIGKDKRSQPPVRRTAERNYGGVL
jgi:hypothetical protein